MQGLRSNGYFELTLSIHYWSLCPLKGIDRFVLFWQLCYIGFVGTNSLKLAGARIGSYIGIVTDIPMLGQLVELNKRAWLLLTHYNVSQYQGVWLQESYTWIWPEWKWVQPGTPQNFIDFFFSCNSVCLASGVYDSHSLSSGSFSSWIASWFLPLDLCTW